MRHQFGAHLCQVGHSSFVPNPLLPSVNHRLGGQKSGARLDLASVVCFAFGVSMAVSFVSVIAASLPLLAVGSRRLQDTGEPGEHAVTPWAKFAVAVLAAHWAVQLSTALNTAFASQSPPDGPGGFGFVLIYGGGSFSLAIAALVDFLLFLNSITPAFAQTMLPSQPGPNKYGPNPHEVPS